MEITKQQIGHFLQLFPGRECLCSRTPSVCCNLSDLGYLLVLAIVPGHLWRGWFALKCLLPWSVREMRGLVISGDGASINWMVVLWPRKENRKRKERKGKGEKKKSTSIAHSSSPSSKKCKTQKVPRLYHTEKHQPLPVTVPGPQPRNVLAYSDLRNPRNCQQSDAGDGFGRLCSPRLGGEKNKDKLPFKSNNNKRKETAKETKLVLKSRSTWE